MLKRSIFSFPVVLLLIAIAWESLKLLGGSSWNYKMNEGARIDFSFNPPLNLQIASDLNMPHVWDIAAAFVNPAQRNGPPLVALLIEAAIFTMREAAVGFAIGALFGLFLGTLFAHSTLLERSLVPYVVASQTVPILAITPIVVAWLQLGWWSVAIIAAYLTFFPVTINTLRGLRSPDPRAIELMRSWAASRWDVLWKMRLPSAAPYIFTALKISATTSIVGAIIAELPSGISGGLGRAILDFNQFYTFGPTKLWATIIMAAMVGILFFAVVVLSEKIALRNMRRQA